MRTLYVYFQYPLVPKKVFPGNIDSDSTVQNPLFDGVVGRHVRIRPKSTFGSTTCMRTELYGVQQDTVCSKIFVGVASSASIPDHRFTASSSYDHRYVPSNARLRNKNIAWEPESDKKSGSWLHIDLGSLVYICAVATQGNPKTHVDEYAKKYKLKLSLDNINWQYYKDENGDDKNIFD
ncbi:Neuropilin-2 [Exaiptasia diaphana]|nr:Neuropilin-2 [Exaiptasia diaphana]